MASIADHNNTTASSTVQVAISIDSKFVGHIIGKARHKINEIYEKSGVEDIYFEEPNQDNNNNNTDEKNIKQDLIIIGSKSQVLLAQQLVNEIIELQNCLPNQFFCFDRGKIKLIMVLPATSYNDVVKLISKSLHNFIKLQVLSVEENFECKNKEMVDCIIIDTKENIGLVKNIADKISIIVDKYIKDKDKTEWYKEAAEELPLVIQRFEQRRLHNKTRKFHTNVPSVTGRILDRYQIHNKPKPKLGKKATGKLKDKEREYNRSMKSGEEQ